MMEVEIELGHKALKNIKPTVEGHTYDWTVFVQGVNGNEIKHIVDKVVFHLPDSYPDTMQIKEKPPFLLSESSSLGFSMEIEIFFCAGSKPNKVSYIYDLSVGEEEVEELWQKKVKFLHFSEDFKKKLLLSGGKVNVQKTSEMNAALIRCKVELDDEIEIIKEIDNVKILDSTSEKVDNLQNESNIDEQLIHFDELFKENEDLKAVNERVKEKTELQEALIEFYKKKLSAWETGILSSNMVINQLKKKVAAYEGEISSLKLQVQMLQDLFSQMQNKSTKSPGAKKSRRKRKNKENLNKSAPVGKKRGDITQPTKAISLPSINDSCISKSPSFIVSEIVPMKSPSIVQNSPPSKPDTILKTSSGKSPQNLSQSNIPSACVNSSSQKKVYSEQTQGVINCQTSAPSDSISVQSANAHIEESIVQRSTEANASLNKSVVMNDNGERAMEGNSIAVDLNECEIINIVCSKPQYNGSMEVSSSLPIPETRKNHVISMEVNPIPLNKHGRRNSNSEEPAQIKCSEKLLKRSSAELIASVNKSKTENGDVVKPVEKNSVSVNKPKNCDIDELVQINCGEKLLQRSLAESDASLNKSKTGNNNIEKSLGKNFVEINAPSNKPENCDIEELVQVNSDKKRSRRNSAEANVALNKSKIQKDVEINSTLDKLANCESEESVKIHCGETQPRANSATAVFLNKTETGNDNVEINASLNNLNNCGSEKLEKINSGEKRPRVDTDEARIALYRSKCIRARSAKANLARSKSGYGNVAKPMVKHSIKIRALNKPEIKKSYIKEPVRIDDGEKPLKESSNKISLNKSETRNRDDQILIEGTSSEVTTPLNKSKTKVDDAEKPILGSSTNTDNSVSKLCTDPLSKNLGEPINTPVKEQDVSSTGKTDTTSPNSNCKENVQKHSNVGEKILVVTSSSTKFAPKTKIQKPNIGYFGNRSSQNKNFSFNSIWRGSHCETNNNSSPNLMGLMSDHYPKLATELNRINNSQFNKFRHKTNPIFYKLESINFGISDKYFMINISRSLTDFLTDPKMSYDQATIVYLIVNYLSSSTIDDRKLPTYIRNQEQYTILPSSESCIVSTIYEIEKLAIPRLHGLLRNLINTLHRVIVSKKRMAVRGLTSLCRVFMELCRLCEDRWVPLFLCCELLKSEQLLGPYLVTSLVGVWRGPFYLQDQYSAEEKILLGSIIYGMSVKPVMMDPNLWRITCELTSTYFPFPIIVEPHEAIQFLAGKIISRCTEGFLKDLWMLTSPLMIFVFNETWEWKIRFGKEYIIPNLLNYSRCYNEPAFNLFCNLYLDICNFCNENPVEDLMKFFTYAALCEGASYVQDCAAIALLKYLGTTDIPFPAPLRNWFLRNISNPKLGVIAELYCKRVMESQDNILLWDDIIIL